jgi:hypothetical protein
MMRWNGLVVAAAVAALAACQEGSKGANAGGEVSGGASASSQSGGRGSAGGSAGAPAGRPAEAPAPTPKPAVILPEGTALNLVFDTTVSSATAKAGDLVVAKLASDVTEGDRVLVPAGSELRGKVLAAAASGRVKGRAHLAVAFDRLVVKGQEHAIEARPIDVTAEAQKGRDAALIGGGAGAGAIVGGIAGGKKGAAIGALAGAGAGGGAVLATKGKEVVFEAGSRHTIKLTRSARIG